MIDRRGFLGILAAGLAAPAVVRASSLMPIKVPASIVTPYTLSYYAKMPHDLVWTHHSKQLRMVTVDGEPIINFSDLRLEMGQHGDGTHLTCAQLEKWNGH